MGLTIHYKLSLDENLSVKVIRELVQRAAHYAQKIGCIKVGEVMRVEADTPFTGLFVIAGLQGVVGGVKVKPAVRDTAIP